MERGSQEAPWRRRQVRFSSSNLRRLILLIYRIGPKNDYTYCRSSVSRIQRSRGALSGRESAWAAMSPVRVIILSSFFYVRDDSMCSYRAQMSCRYPERGSLLPFPASSSVNFSLAFYTVAVTQYFTFIEKTSFLSSDSERKTCFSHILPSMQKSITNLLPLTGYPATYIWLITAKMRSMALRQDIRTVSPPFSTLSPVFTIFVVRERCLKWLKYCFCCSMRYSSISVKHSCPMRYLFFACLAQPYVRECAGSQSFLLIELQVALRALTVFLSEVIRSASRGSCCSVLYLLILRMVVLVICRLTASRRLTLALPPLSLEDLTDSLELSQLRVNKSSWF